MNEWVELGQNKDGTHNICCGVCGVGKFKSKGHARSYYTRHKFKYCPNCGAKMNADRKTEPQLTEKCPFDDSLPCEWVCTEFGKCKYKPQTEPQTDCSWK